MAFISEAPEVWSVMHTMRFPGGVRLPSRMTVVRLPGGELLLHSPVPPDDELLAEVAHLGPVAHIVAPSLLHHLFVRAWMDRSPGARLWVAPGLAGKRHDLPAHEPLGEQAPEAWRGVIDQLPIRGQPRMNEVAFLHRPSRTLIVSDLVFNVGRPRTLPTELVLRLMGTHGGLASSRLWRSYTRDRAAVRASIERLLAWDFDRVLMGHGDAFGPGARPAMALALARTLRA
jgi:hypothetical protein